MKPCRFLTAAFIGLLLLPSVAAGADATNEALQKGKASSDKGDYDAAIAAFSELIRLDPKNAEAYFYRGWTYECKGDHDKAIADCSEAIRLKPGYADAYSGRAFAFTMKGDRHEAIADYSEVIRLNTKDAKAYYNRGIVYVKEGEYDKAIADLTEAIRLDQKDATAYRQERQAAGIEVAKRKGIYKGRQKGTTKAEPSRAMQLRAKGLTVAEIATAFGANKRTVQRYLKLACGEVVAK